MDTNDSDIMKEISKIMERLAGEQERSLLGLPAQPPGELLTSATPESAAKLTSTTLPDWDAIRNLASAMQETRRKLGVAPDGNIWYHESAYAPKVDSRTGDLTFFFLDTHGYYILHPDNVPILRSLVAQAGYDLRLMERDMMSAPGWKIPAGYDLTRWPRPLPESDGEAISRLRTGQTPEQGQRLQSVFEMRRAKGESLLDAYQHTLEAVVFGPDRTDGGKGEVS